MDAQIITLEPKEISLSIKEADVGILYIIQHELLKESKIDFAGVIVKEPLTGEIHMRINCNTKPLGEMKKATDSAIKMAEEFKKLFNSKIKEN